MPVTYQATFGTVGAIHASDSLKHERGVSPGQTCGFRSQAIPTGQGRRVAAALQFIPNLSKHGRPDPQGMGLWSVGLWGFVLFLLRTFFFLLCPKCLMHYRIWAYVGTFGCRLKGQWGRGGEAFREGGEGRVRVRDSH